MKPYPAVVLLLLLPVFLIGCDSGGAEEPDPPESDPSPVIASVDPTSGKLGTMVTITGEHFSATGWRTPSPSTARRRR